MDVVLMIVYGLLILSFLVVIHEAGHYFAAKAFGVRVTEFMIGLPGPNIGFTKGETKFGITPILLGGYARVCGMEFGPLQPYGEEVLAALYRRGTANMEDIALDCDITDEEAFDALEELVEWGSITGPEKQDEFNTYRAPRDAKTGAEAGEPRAVEDAHALYESERARQYRSLPFWKRTVILLAGIMANFLVALLFFVIAYSVIGVDVQLSTGEMQHILLTPLHAIQAGLMYIGMVFQAVAGLFNPLTAAETVSNSTSVVGIAVISKTVVDSGFVSLLEFVAMISVSLGVVNLVPLLPLDGGRFAVEIYQKVSGRLASERAMNIITMVGLGLMLLLFAVLLNQDIQRFVLGAG